MSMLRGRRPPKDMVPAVVWIPVFPQKPYVDLLTDLSLCLIFIFSSLSFPRIFFRKAPTLGQQEDSEGKGVNGWSSIQSKSHNPTDPGKSADAGKHLRM